ncbi:hypothetical protein AA0488_0590 [Kozakia baliensis NRIC 0488]|nr:hypothetical protein AA0488_0590 [Kozakia baliensis NRIC 0488]GEL63931.1 hypothetical protein KBA01_12170 [Kozakia baliensis]
MLNKIKRIGVKDWISALHNIASHRITIRLYGAMDGNPPIFMPCQCDLRIMRRTTYKPIDTCAAASIVGNGMTRHLHPTNPEKDCKA